MKLHEALRKILKQFGTSVMQDGKRLMSMMADFHAFEDYPAMKQVRERRLRALHRVSQAVACSDPSFP